MKPSSVFRDALVSLKVLEDSNSKCLKILLQTNCRSCRFSIA